MTSNLQPLIVYAHDLCFVPLVAYRWHHVFCPISDVICKLSQCSPPREINVNIPDKEDTCGMVRMKNINRINTYGSILAMLAHADFPAQLSNI